MIIIRKAQKKKTVFRVLFKVHKDSCCPHYR